VSTPLVGALVENTPDALLVVSRGGRVEAISEAARAMLGPRARVGDALADLLADPAVVREVLRRGLARKTPTPLRLSFRHDDAQLLDLRAECWRIGGADSAWVVVRLLESGAGLEGFVQLTATIDALNREIRAKDRILDALREQQAENQRIESEAAIGTWRWRPDAAAPELSEEAMRLLEQPRGAVLDLGTYLRKVVRADRARVVSALRALAQGRPRAIELEHDIRVAGGRRSLRVGAEIGSGNAARAPRVIGFVQDMTAHKRAEARRRRDAQRFASVLEAMSGGVVLFDETGAITQFNAAAQRLFARTARAVVGTSVHDLFAPSAGLGRDGAEALVAELRRRRPGAGYLRMRDGGGNEFPAEVSAAAVDEENGALYALTIRDATEREQLEAKLREAVKLEAIGNLTGGIAHDFNNLLTIIMASAEMGLIEAADDSELHESLDLVRSAARSGAELTRKLLSFARRQTLAPEASDLAEIARECTRLGRRTVEENIRFDLELDEALPPVLVDAGELEAALLNLVVNARHAMPDGGRILIRTTSVVIDTDPVSGEQGLAPGAYAMIAVRDDGIGMSAETLGRVFEPFFTTRETGEGSGLGLSHVYGFARQSGGHVDIESAEGAGTEVRIHLPFANTPSAPDARPAAQGAVGRGEHVLLVEDDPSVRRVLARQLERLGYRVTAVDDARAALAALDGGADVDAVMTDVVMPGDMGGLELVAALDEREHALPVVLISGYPRSRIQEQLGPRGDVAFLGKPISREKLGEALHAVLGPY
jgi:PAS domain S-box-containing protein